MTLAFTSLGSGADLVLLHGWGMHSGVWDGFAQGLGAHYRLCLIDLPGHGDSPYGGERALAEWSRSCLQVAPKQATWLGWSLGALLALQAALQEPQRVSAILGLCGTPRFVQTHDWPHAMLKQTLQAFIVASQQDHRKTLERFLSLQLRGGDDSLETLRRLRGLIRTRPEPHPAALEAGLNLLKGVDLRDELAQLVCPSGWLFGERDTLVPAAVALSLNEWLPRAITRVVPDTAHAPFLSHPAATLAVVHALLESFHVV
jgi:pimeloyl-[acyl-carrier protein] methyl ester esterase